MKSALKAMKGKITAEGPAEGKFNAALCDEEVMSALVSMSRLPVFSKEFGTAFRDDLDLLHALKQIKYFWNLPQSQIAILMANLARQLEVNQGSQQAVASRCPCQVHGECCLPGGGRC